MTEYANEEHGVPAFRDGIPQDPNNHNGPKPGDATSVPEEVDVDEDRQARVEKAKAADKPETPETARKSGRTVADKPETR